MTSSTVTTLTTGNATPRVRGVALPVVRVVTVYDDIINCDHSYDRQCHTSYTTVFDAQQEEECEENYIKRCYIAYENFAFNETVKVCRTPLVKDCDIPGE